MAYITLTVPGRRYPKLCPPSQDVFHDIGGPLIVLGGYGEWGEINVWPVKPFGTVTVIKGYTNTIELHLT